MDRIVGKLLGLKAYFLVGLACMAIGGAGGFGLAWKLQGATIAGMKTEYATAKTEAVTAALKVERARAVVTAKSSVEAELHQQEIRTVTRTIVERVPVYVTLETDQRFAIPVGLGRVHDAAALGVESVPSPTGQPDGEPSGIAASTLAATLADNYGVCRATRQTLIDLQSWVRSQQAITSP